MSKVKEMTLYEIRLAKDSGMDKNQIDFVKKLIKKRVEAHENAIEELKDGYQFEIERLTDV